MLSWAPQGWEDRQDLATYPDSVLPAGADPRGFGQVEEEVSRFVEGVDLTPKTSVGLSHPIGIYADKHEDCSILTWATPELGGERRVVCPIGL
jgi:hypothetical protein